MAENNNSGRVLRSAARRLAEELDDQNTDQIEGTSLFLFLESEILTFLKHIYDFHELFWSVRFKLVF